MFHNERRQEKSRKNQNTGSHTNKNNNTNNKRPKFSGPPSEEALQLSDQLKKLSREKKLDEALELYWDKSNDTIRDGHHACTMVDMTARCGDISQGERLLEKVEKEGTYISVQTKTALLKGFCHSGCIEKAHDLFLSMCLSKRKIDHPNVRTLNTLLRGCLWSAATTTKDDVLLGGIVTAEMAWEKCKGLSIAFDVSSYEYSITLLCQALRVEDAIARISEMKQAFGLAKEQKVTASNDDQSLTEALAIAYCSLTRAYTILNEEKKAVDACETSLAFASTSKDALKRGDSFSSKSLLLLLLSLFDRDFRILLLYVLVQANFDVTNNFVCVCETYHLYSSFRSTFIFQENVVGKKVRIKKTIEEPNLMLFTVIIA